MVAEVDGQIAGFSSFGPFRPFDAYQYTVESSVYVHENFRRRGIARLLVQPLITIATDMNLHSLIAGIDAANEPSIRLHQQLGFREAGLIKAAGYKFDRWLDLLFMQLILPSGPRGSASE